MNLNKYTQKVKAELIDRLPLINSLNYKLDRIKQLMVIQQPYLINSFKMELPISDVVNSILIYEKNIRNTQI